MLAAVKTLLGITTEDQDAVLQLMIDDAKAAVRDYCHRKDCPEQLDHVVRELVIDAYTESTEGRIESVRSGDTQISYCSTITGNSFTERQRSVMNRYRKIRFD